MQAIKILLGWVAVAAAAIGVPWVLTLYGVAIGVVK